MPVLFHLADLHIGAPYDSLPPEAACVCRASQLAALEHAVDRANDLDAAVILIPGDLFDTPDPPLTLFSQVMSLLARAHCPVLISPGNHDYLHPHSPYRIAHMPQGIHVFSGTTLEPFALDDGHTVIWGAAFHGVSARIALDAPLDCQKCNILCVHAELYDDNGYNPLQPDAIGASGFDYAAFGHNHTFSGVKREDDTFYACTGCFVGRGAHEAGSRGYLCGTVDKGVAELAFVPAGGVEFETLTQDISAIMDDRTLGRTLAARIPHAHDRMCLTVELTGERRYEPDFAGLKRALGQVCVHAALRDRTVVVRDPWRYLAEDGLRGAITRRFRKAWEEANESERPTRLLSLQYALAALDGEDTPL